MRPADYTTPLYSLLAANQAALRDVDAVQELPDVLVPDQAALVDVGAGLGDVLHVVAAQHQLVLDAGRAHNLDAREHIDNAHALLAQEVADLDHGTVLLNVGVDGKVGVDQAHLVLEAFGDASDHVLDVGDAGADRRQRLLLAEVAIDLEHLLAILLGQEHVQAEVLEVLRQDAAGALDAHGPAIKTTRNAISVYNLYAYIARSAQDKEGRHGRRGGALPALHLDGDAGRNDQLIAGEELLHFGSRLTQKERYWAAGPPISELVEGKGIRKSPACAARFWALYALHLHLIT